MTHAIRIKEFGGPEKLEFMEIELGEPGPGQARIAHTAIGVNFIDTYHRSGLYPIELPAGLGGEAAGTVVSVGEGVEHVTPGDRVCYAVPKPSTSYSEESVIDAMWLIKIPEDVADETAAAIMLKGLTSWYLLRQTYEVQEGDTILLYAAAGGVGLIAAQWAEHLGARVIGVVSTEEKRQLALSHGCTEVLLADSDIVTAVRDITNGDGVPVVYDPVGKDTLYQSLDCLCRRGLLVSFGNASGAVDCLPLLELAKRGSLYVTRPVLGSNVTNREELELASGELLGLLSDGCLQVEIGQRFALADAADAHRALESRRTKGSTVLLP
ncbi:MAG: quinone oxidoreductase family protein [Candidatus Rariloculaceae bacterium]